MEIDLVREWIIEAASALNANEPDVRAALDALEQAVGWYAARDRAKREKITDLMVRRERERKAWVASGDSDTNSWRARNQHISAEIARLEFELAEDTV